MKEISADYAKKLAHDLKSPLSALKVLLSILENEEQKDLLKSSIERYELIISDLDKKTKL